MSYVSSSTTNAVNFALRQNKTIERSLVFEGLSLLSSVLDYQRYIYVGLGSVWFADFQLAHRILGIESMLSIEADHVVANRAEFNKPYRTVQVIEGASYDVLPDLFERDDLRSSPWVVWLDYDKALLEDQITELGDLMRRLPDDSILITTFSARGNRYSSKPSQRRARLVELFGKALFDQVADEAWTIEDLSPILAPTVLQYMESLHIHSGRRGRFWPSFSVRYKDNTWMVTAGGVIASEDRSEEVGSIVQARQWPCLPPRPIDASPLTPREIWALQAELPVEGGLTPDVLGRVGFLLNDGTLQCFSDHYLRFPVFSQVTS